MSRSDLPGHKCSHRYSSGRQLAPQKAAVTGSWPVLFRTSQCSITAGFKNNWQWSSWFLVTFLQLKPWNHQKQLCILLPVAYYQHNFPGLAALWVPGFGSLSHLARQLLLQGHPGAIGLCASVVKRHCSAKAEQIHLSNVTNTCYMILYCQWQKTWHKRQKSW